MNFSKGILRTMAMTMVLLLVFMCGVPLSLAAESVSVTSVKLDMKKATVPPGMTLQLTASVLPTNADNQALTWSSDNTSVAKVSNKGLVTAQKAGKATITATAKDGSKKSAKCVITVKYVKATKLTLNTSLRTMSIGETVRIKATVKPSGASYKGVKWTSSASKIAKVDKDGNVTARKAGVATIKAVHEEGKLMAECTIQVRKKDPVSITISAIGDVILGGDPRYGTEKKFADYLAKRGGKMSSTFSKVYSVLSKDDITLANLEAALTTRTGYNPEKRYVFRGKPAYAKILKAGSVEVANLANNHVADFGYGGYEDTKNALKKQGIPYAGISGDPTPIYTVKGVKVGFYGQMSNKKSVSTIRKDIVALKKKCDVVVASFHWTDVPEKTYAVKPSQKKMARAAVDAGADLVVGHHSHVISGIEIYKGKYIVYSLGNFVVVGTGGDFDTFIFQQTFNVHKGFAEDGGINVIPCLISSNPDVNNIQPMIATGDAAKKIIKKIKKYSKNLLGSPVF